MKRQVNLTSSKIPETLKKPHKVFSYGTSGYRDSADELSNTLCRASLIALIRSSTFCGKTTGLMITASHNKNTDNGMKIIDHSGDYIEKSFEVYCDEIVNCEDKDLVKVLSRVHRKIGNARDFGDGPIPNVAIGRDTRESGGELVEKIKKVLELYGAKVVDYGIVTTPQLHFLIRKTNQLGKFIEKNEYIEHLLALYTSLCRENDIMREDVFVDCASGVGGIIIDQLMKRNDIQKFEIINRSVKGSNETFEPDFNLLNHKCGADYILTNNYVPENITVDKDMIKKCAAFDGDADRLIYFSAVPAVRIFDGDKQAVFIANYLCGLIRDLKNFTIGAVFSHYSNSAAKNALNERVKYTTANTGVKNFVAISRDFDIGVFFEPNGHGSVTFSSAILRHINEILTQNDESFYLYRHAYLLKIVSELFDPCVGDAVANFLFFEAVFEENSFDKILALFEKLPTRHLQVKIKDKGVIKMDSDIDISEPKELRDRIKMLCTKYRGRSFIRPSGTEDLIRVFAESHKQEDCDILAVNVAQAVYDICEGIGNQPEIKYL